MREEVNILKEQYTELEIEIVCFEGEKVICNDGWVTDRQGNIGGPKDTGEYDGDDWA